MIDDLEGMATFVAVAETKGFRAAGERLGVTGSAVSQTIRKLEERLGVTLVQRTTRSVGLTEAGERLYAAVRPALNDVRAAAASVSEMAQTPKGPLRIHVSTSASGYLSGTMLAGFLSQYAAVQLDLVIDDEPIDIVTAGYHAGIRLGEVINRDMIAVPVSGDLRLLVVGSPAYFARYPKPAHPRDLAYHECINWHSNANALPYRWEFTENGREFSVAVPTRVITTDPALNLRIARAGLGLTLGSEDRVRDDLANGTLVSVLEEFSTPFPGFYLYYPQRKHVPPALRALIDYMRLERRGSSSR